MCLMACAQVIFHRAQRKLLQACVQLKGFISLVFPDVQQQPNHYDSGLFALAYASSVCNNLDPATINYDQHCLRLHFLNCLKNGEFKSFPCEPKPRNPQPPLRNSFRVNCIVFAVYQTGEMIWFNVNFVMNGTISLVLISKLEIKYLVYGSRNVINMDPVLSQN